MATPTVGGILRIGSYAGIAGALLGLVGNLLHPATPIGDPEGVARTIADSRLWVPDHLAIVLGLILMLGGLAVAWSRTYPRWLGWIVALAGAGSILAGLIQAAAGQPTTITRVLTIIFPTVITLWLVEMNLLVLRKAPALQRAITQDP